MKNLTKIYIPFVLGIFLILSSCSLDSSSTNKSDDGETSVDNFVAGDGKFIAPTYTNCNCPASPTSNYEITEECAQCMRDNFKANNYQFYAAPSGSIEGFLVAHTELTEILKDLNADNKAKVYSMMGIKATADGSGGQNIVSDIYHQVQTPDGVGGYSSVYYDFTQPCPNFCPK